MELGETKNDLNILVCAKKRTINTNISLSLPTDYNKKEVTYFKKGMLVFEKQKYENI